MSLRHVLLVTVLWSAARAEAGEPPPSAAAGGSLDTDQLLRLIVSDVTANIRPLVDQITTRIEGMDARLISFESRLNALDSKQSTFDARLAGLVSRADSMNEELTTTVEKTASRFVSETNWLNSKLDQLTTRIDTMDSEHIARLEQLTLRIDTVDNDRNVTLEELTSLVESTDNELRSQLEKVASQGNTSDTKIRSRLEEVATQCYSSDTEQLSYRLDNLTSLVDELFRPRDCSELPPGSQSGTYLLQPGSARSGPPITGYCDQDTDGGGWTVIQCRADILPRESFNRTWADYREGFGSLDKEFWWGLENLWRMTGPRDRQYQLRVDLADFEGRRRHAVYQRFSVASEADGYRLSVGGYSGDAGDRLAYHNGSRFSTGDRDQDAASWNCARKHNGGWWFSACYRAYLNGLYLPGKRERAEGVNWYLWSPSGWYSLKEADMKLRPVNAV